MQRGYTTEQLQRMLCVECALQHELPDANTVGLHTHWRITSSIGEPNPPLPVPGCSAVGTVVTVTFVTAGPHRTPFTSLRD